MCRIATSLFLLLAATAHAQPIPATATEMRIDPVVQKRRDVDRLQILTDELKIEQAALVKAQKLLQEAQATRQLDKIKDQTDFVARHVANIDSLNKEIARMSKQQIDAASPPSSPSNPTRSATIERDQKWLIVGQSTPSTAAQETQEKPAPIRHNATNQPRRPLAEKKQTNTPEWVILQY